MDFEIVSANRCFDGEQRVYRFASAATGGPMEAAVFLPAAALAGEKLPALIYLSGLTCTWENVTSKAGAQRCCAERGMIFIAPDTSPRGEGVADDEAYDLGQGAGFYLTATQDPWAAHFDMQTHVVEEIAGALAAHLPVAGDGLGLTGHSMGGHGALTLAMKNPDRFRSVSAFAPIVNPMAVPWGRKAFSAYLGDDESAWAAYDACALVAERGWQGDILIDQGVADGFLDEQLKPENFLRACEAAGVSLSLTMRPGYDHSYYFIASFIDDHIAWHAERLGA